MFYLVRIICRFWLLQKDTNMETLRIKKFVATLSYVMPEIRCKKLLTDKFLNSHVQPKQCH